MMLFSHWLFWLKNSCKGFIAFLKVFNYFPPYHLLKLILLSFTVISYFECSYLWRYTNTYMKTCTYPIYDIPFKYISQFRNSVNISQYFVFKSFTRVVFIKMVMVGACRQKYKTSKFWQLNKVFFRGKIHKLARISNYFAPRLCHGGL